MLVRLAGDSSVRLRTISRFVSRDFLVKSDIQIDLEIVREQQEEYRDVCDLCFDLLQPLDVLPDCSGALGVAPEK